MGHPITPDMPIPPSSDGPPEMPSTAPEPRVIEAATIRPGDHIVFAIPDTGSLEGLQDIRDQLRDRFPDNEITLVNANGLAVLARTGGEYTPQEAPCSE